MTSHPPGPCCVAEPQVGHTASAAGSIKTIGDTRNYFACPSSNDHSRGIILFPEANGIDYVETQLMADAFANQGYLVVVPDLFHGDPHYVGRTDDIYEWLKLHTTERVDPVVQETLAEMWRLGCKAIGGVGYCFGAKYVIRNMTGAEGGLSAGFVAHPSFVTAEELEVIQRPLSIAAAESDYIFTTEKRRESETILMKSDVPWQITLYSDVEHSFALRGDVSVRRIRWAKEQAFRQAVAWFKEHVDENEGE